MRFHPLSLNALTLFASLGASLALDPVAPLGPGDALRRDLAPYDLAELNYLGMNYCENLLDSRVNITSYTHLGYDANNRDAWHLQFPDDAARLLEGLAWEDEYSPVARVELARRLVKGILRGHIPGSKDYYSFRHRSGGKTFLILGGKDAGGRLVLANWGDALEGCLKVGFRLQRNSVWHATDGFAFTDSPTGAGESSVARNARYWHSSPFQFRRSFAREGQAVDFTGRYWLSDEDKPLEFGFSSGSGDALQIVLGEPGKPMPLLGDPASPTFVHLPDETVIRIDPNKTRSFDKPDYPYFILRRTTAWACPGYSTALLVVLDQRPERIDLFREGQVGEVCLNYPAREGLAQGRVWLYPYSWVNDADMRHIHRSARAFISRGTLEQNGYPSQQLVNAVPAGLAAGACLLARYKDPFATTAAVQAEGAAEAVLAPLADGKAFVRSFFPVRAAAWMVQLGKESGNSRLVNKFIPHLERWMKQMTGPSLGYDGKGWGNGWDHFNCLKAVWLAYSATGNAEYRAIYDRALSVYTIDEKGIYRDGVPLKAPGGFETYAGALPLGAWGHAGRLEDVHKLINLNVPNGWHSPELPVKALWNDAGAGPWAQDDSNPEYVGFSLRGLNLPVTNKWVVPVGAFPSYDSKGVVSLPGGQIVRNPYFRPGRDPVLQLPGDASKLNVAFTSIDVVPGSRSEAEYLLSSSGKMHEGVWSCKAHQQLVYKFDTRSIKGAAVDCQISGDGYRIEVSPDGQRWLGSYDSWSDAFTLKSLDLSFLTGSADELVKLYTIFPPGDASVLTEPGMSEVDGNHCRYLASKDSIVYQLDLRGAGECHVDLLAGNGYKLEGSSDGQTWKCLLAADQIDQKRTPDAAWLWSADATECLSSTGKLYLRFSDTGQAQRYGGRSAFLRRLTIYGNLKSEVVWIRFANTDPTRNFLMKQMVVRTWR